MLARLQGANVLVFIVALVVTDKGVVACDVLMLVGELFAVGGQDRLKPEIEAEFGARAAEDQFVAGFMDQRCGRVIDDLPDEKSRQADQKQTAIRDRPCDTPLDREQDWKRQSGARLGTGEGRKFGVRCEGFATHVVVAARLGRNGSGRAGRGGFGHGCPAILP